MRLQAHPTPIQPPNKSNPKPKYFLYAMAGLQYRFFPTDFMFPSPPTTARDGGNNNQVPMVKPPKADETDNDAKAIAAVNSKSLKATSSSNATALAPIIHKHNRTSFPAE
ncbi:hypothetical protein CDL12_04921 [Handroanthus impetiginosus]|uniref:Uncharacterized protein n=1 Tax=Handroanthus impetiginosus TaxID=429701 RepID=A0A2G9HXY2_9LAMI|nr:hypothetical protein CDL12_04921 [Handroanthus impetiginosus]